jgi:23S rRNA (pseudouridine1915-N3)-methyltransferase
MIRAEIIAVGRMRQKSQKLMWDEYYKRLKWPIKLIEIEGKSPKEEEDKLLKKINPRAYKIFLDEKGTTLSSPEFCKKIENETINGNTDFQFFLGGADGHTSNLISHANFILSFGKQTWPHMLARIMLLEQIYRAQQIIEGHPYHRN